MGQSSISMLNKVGYSMFWNSMWDNKISYSRNLKEDFFLTKFFDLIFNDNVSANITFLKKNKNSSFVLNKYKIDIDEKTNSLRKYLIGKNNLKVTHSKVWILKYQKWVIFYKFIYIKNLDKNNALKKPLSYGNNFFFFYKFYQKSIYKVNSKYNFYKTHVKNHLF